MPQCLGLALDSGFHVERARTSSLVPSLFVLFSQWLYLHTRACSGLHAFLR